MNDTITHAPQVEVSTGVFKGRWGYYPCSWETYQLLRRLNRAWLKAERATHTWLRWRLKAPQNRVFRRWSHNDAGQKTGSVPGAPRPEPFLDPRFIRMMERHEYHDAGAYHSAGVTVPRPQVDYAVRQAYLMARYPQLTPERVRPLFLSVEQIRALLGS